MQRPIFIVLLPLICFTAMLRAQANQWTWMHGGNVFNQAGIYGTQGVPAPANVPPARYECAQWTDAQGNFWLYGGGLGSNRFSDLWKYDPLTNMWAWMHGSTIPNQPAVYGTQGVAAPGNTPGGIGFGACSWTDNSGNLWLFGGDDGSNPPFDNLWKYDPLANMWTWMKGSGTPGPPAVYGVQGVAAPGNTPGARVETACTWTDNSGNLWLFGGSPAGAGSSYNDLWKYDPLTNMWTWMKGANFPNPPATYGVQGVPAAANTPGGRWCYTSWKDNSGNLWLFGGIDAGSIIGMGFFNDLWRYDPLTNMWTWMSGSNQPNQPGVYGTKCVGSTNNIPGGRGETRTCWRDACGNFWLFGGRDLNFDLWNDLWRYEPATGRWTWVSGDNLPNQTGVYGTITVPAPANKPGNRMGAVSWANTSGLWLFGGYDYSGGEYNDLWRYTPDTISAAISATPLSGCAPLAVNFTNNTQINCATAKNYQWTFGDPASGAADTAITQNATHIYNDSGTFLVTLIAFDCQGRRDTAHTVITVTPGINLQDTVTASGCQSPSGTATVIAAGGNGTYTYQWQPSGGTAATATNLSPGAYTVTVTDGAGCTAADTMTVGLSGQLQVSIGNDTVICGAGTVTLAANLASVQYSWSTGDTTASILVSQAGTYVLVASTGLCSATDSATIGFVSAPVPQAVPDLCDQSVVNLSVSSLAGSVYTWSTGDTAQQISVTQPGLYWVNVTNGPCNFSDTLRVPEVSGSSALWFPNSFTPNGDGKNETFSAEGEGVLQFHMMIFDRWGQLIFETNDFSMRWDGRFKGRTVQEDVYVWVADYRLDCGGNQQFRKRGHVSVIR